ncbi:hypothetical protein [Nonlabens ponticola]|uniref:Trimeric autotransporter adhesin YadA-like head domain-containing protein n=1 Tax=Nonlabens ponticola TaxID=2496866 RepID=A0A3S9N0C0_9FLAO|nr:hypothetical protein [Nonlabens ponticola]AZQ44870.1 hypothetical protein EJ995_11755 [Nonlabens ponticola]
MRFLILVALLISHCAFSQVGINTTNPDASAILDISSDSQGLLAPRMTETQREAISTPATGLLVYQTEDPSGFWYYDGTQWIQLIFAESNEFISQSGVVHNTTSLKNDDFAFGSDQLDNDTSTTDDDKRFFFDKSKAAFRAGQATGDTFDAVNVGTTSIAFGLNPTASGTSSVAMGRLTRATGTYALALGRSTLASGESSTAFGYLGEASGRYSTIMGRANTASGEHSFAIGIANDAAADNAVAMGNTNESSGIGSFTQGRLNDAIGEYSFAQGFTNVASGNNALAIGSFNNASGVNATTIGNGLIAKSYVETVLGNYNSNYTPTSTTTYEGNDRLFTVGNGFRVGEVTTRNNALTILKNGNVGIGTATPSEALEIHGDDNFSGDADFDAHSYGSNITTFHIRSAAGTQANPLPVSGKSNFNFYNMEAQGYDGSSYRNAAAIRMGSMANNLTGAGDMPGRIDFHTSLDGTVNNRLRMRIDDRGNVGINTGTAAIDEKLVVEGKIKATEINFSNLPIADTDAAATTAGLETGDVYQTSSGVLRIKQ